jgi:NAD(P)-dependent dehydrogenase (short-subunit alcohol dehydrogenase family)
MSLAAEWGDYGIRVNGIAPGPIRDTEGMKRLGPVEDQEKLVAPVVPLGRMGTKEEIGNLCTHRLFRSLFYFPN